MAYVLNGQRDDHETNNVLDTIPVPPTGWTDLAEVRQLGQKWIQARNA